MGLTRRGPKSLPAVEISRNKVQSQKKASARSQKGGSCKQQRLRDTCSEAAGRLLPQMRPPHSTSKV